LQDRVRIQSFQDVHGLELHSDNCASSASCFARSIKPALAKVSSFLFCACTLFLVLNDPNEALSTECRPFRRGVHGFVSRVFDLPIVGVFRTLHVMLFFLGITFGGALSVVRNLRTQKDMMDDSAYVTPNYEVAYLSKRWRAERNVWLSAFAFTSWAVLAAFYREMGRRLRLEERLVDYEMSAGYTATVDDTTRELSQSREVTSKKNDLLSPRSMTESPVKHPPPRGGIPRAGVAAADNAKALNETTPRGRAPEVELLPTTKPLEKKDQ